GLVFHREFYFGERFAFDGDESGDDGKLGNGGEDATVGKAGPSERERGGFAGLTGITESGLQWIKRGGAERWIHLFHIHPFEATGLFGGELQGARTLHQRFAGFALGVIEG